MATIGTIKCDAKGEIKVADLLAYINNLAISVGDSYSKKEADDRFVNVTGDTMTGHLRIVSPGKISLHGQTWIEGKSGKLYQNSKEVLDATTGLKKSEPSTVLLRTGGKEYMYIHATSGINFGHQLSGTIKYKGNQIWHAGNSKGIRTKLSGNTLYMTDNQTNP